MALSARLGGAARRAGIAALGALAAGLVMAAPAGAHGGSAVLEVLEAAEVAPGEVGLRVAVTYESDGEVADGAIVEVTATGPSGGAEPSTRLEREAAGDAYAARLELPEDGVWLLAITSSFPPGGTEVEVAVGSTGDEPEGEGTEASAADGPAEGDEPDGAGLDEPEAGGAEGGSDTTNLVVAGLSGVVGGGLGLWASRRRSARKQAAAVAPD